MSLSKICETRPYLTRFFCVLVLVLLTVTAYLGVKNCGFITFDDPDYVTQNPYVKRGLEAETVKWAFTQFHSSNWHPLTWCSHMLDVELFGLKPLGHHFHNVLLHSLNVTLLFLLLGRITASYGKAFLVAALFAVHPLHVESVAWVAERKDVLSTFFGLLCLMAYTGYAKARGEGRGARGQYALALVLFALGLMSKPMLVTWPCVMLLLDLWPLRRFANTSSFFHLPFAKRLVLEKLPFFVLSAVSCVITMRSQGTGRSVVSLEWLPLDVRIGNSLAAILDYLTRTVMPTKLAVFYPFPAELPVERAVMSGALLVFLFVIAIRFLKTQAWMFVGLSWFVGTLIPVIGLVQVGMQGSADRYTYIPHIGLFIVVVWGLFHISSRLKAGNLMVAFSLVAFSVVCWFLTVRQVDVWRTDETLFKNAKEVTDRNYIALTIYGRQLAEKGRNEEALTHYRQALEIQPRYAASHYVIGDVYRSLGRTNDALASYGEAIRLDPFHAESLNSRGSLLSNINREDEAIADFKKAIEALPWYEIPRLNMGIVLQRQGKFPDAAHMFKEYLKIDPQSGKVLTLLGDVEFRMEQYTSAIGHYQAALGIDSKRSSTRYGLACALAAANRFADAENTLSLLLAEDKQMPEAYFQLGVSQCALNKPAQAITNLQRAVEMRSTNALYRYHLANALGQAGRKGESIKMYDETIQLDHEFAEPLNNLAWILAADSDPALRNGIRAVELAERAVKLTDQKEAFLLGTLAAAYAEAGRFDDAVKTAQRAIERANAANQPDLAARNAELLELYRAGKPYHEPSQAPTSK